MLTAILIVLVLIFLLMLLGRDGFALGAMGCLIQLFRFGFIIIVGIIILILILTG